MLKSSVRIKNGTPCLTIDGKDVYENEDLVQYPDIWEAVHKRLPEFGFILRFPEDKQDVTGIIYEPWHFRYVGRYHATRMHELNMCLEEYIDYLTENDYFVK